MKYLVSAIIIFFSFTTIEAQEVGQASLLAHWSDDSLPASFAHNNTYNEIWGLSVNDREFAVIGSTMGTHIIDVTDTESIEEIFFIEGAITGGGIIHRDYHDNDGFLYAVCDEGNSTLQIIDVRDLPNSIEVVYDDNSLISRSHNIFIDEENDRLYSCTNNGVVTSFSALRIFDISDPMSPVDLGGTNVFETFVVGHVHDAYVKENVAYLNCGPAGFAIVDMTDLDSLKLMGSLESDDYPDSGYNHSGWLAEEGDVYYMADENHGLAVKAIKVDDLSDLETTTLFDVGIDKPDAIAHNLIVDGNYLYVSYYYDGLQIFDITDREVPVRIGEYPTSQLENNLAYRGAWGVYPFLPSGNILVSDMQEGLFVVDREIMISSNDGYVESTFSIFPNPAVDQLQVSLVEDGIYSYRIKDLNGRILNAGDILGNQHSIYTTDLRSGSYILEVLDGQQVQAQMFSITK